jgi:hypothetical protein
MPARRSRIGFVFPPKTYRSSTSPMAKATPAPAATATGT